MLVIKDFCLFFFFLSILVSHAALSVFSPTLTYNTISLSETLSASSHLKVCTVTCHPNSQHQLWQRCQYENRSRSESPGQKYSPLKAWERQNQPVSGKVVRRSSLCYKHIDLFLSPKDKIFNFFFSAGK